MFLPISIGVPMTNMKEARLLTGPAASGFEDLSKLKQAKSETLPIK